MFDSSDNLTNLMVSVMVSSKSSPDTATTGGFIESSKATISSSSRRERERECKLRYHTCGCREPRTCGGSLVLLGDGCIFRLRASKSITKTKQISPRKVFTEFAVTFTKTPRKF